MIQAADNENSFKNVFMTTEHFCVADKACGYVYVLVKSSTYAYNMLWEVH